MDDPKPWLTLARAGNLHAGHLARAGTGPSSPLDLLRETRANPDPRGLAADERWLQGPHQSVLNPGTAKCPPLPLGAGACGRDQHIAPIAC